MNIDQKMNGPAMRQPAGDDRGGRLGAVWGPLELVTAVFAVLVIAGVLLSLAAVLLSVLGVPSNAAENDPVGAPILLLTQAVLDAGAVGFAAWISLRRRRLTIGAWWLRPRRPFAVLPCTMVLIGSFLAIALYTSIVQILGIDDMTPRENLPQFFFSDSRVIPFAIFLVLVVAPIAEEMFFRAFVFRGLIGSLGFYGGAAASGLLFSLIHLSNGDMIGLIIPFSVIGFLFAVLAGKTGSLYNAILVHFSFNLLSAMENLVTGRQGLGLSIAIIFIAALYTVIWRVQVARGVNHLRNDTA